MRATCTVGYAMSAIVLGASLARGAEPKSVTWNIDGAKRIAIVHSPTQQASDGAPLLLIFHGLSGNKAAESLSRAWHFDECWPEAFVVYMQGLRIPAASTKDSNRTLTGWQRTPGDDGNRDLKFVDAVVTDFKENHHIDRRRVYAMGFSNGGSFISVLWSERPGTFAAFAPCAGGLNTRVKLKIPRPVFVTMGRAEQAASIKAEEAYIELVRNLNGATTAGTSTTGGVTLYESTKDAPVVTLLHPRGHILPKEAPQLIVDFFQAHPLKR
jgi:polyhydroxybutyrate depolymerase